MPSSADAPSLPASSQSPLIRMGCAGRAVLAYAAVGIGLGVSDPGGRP